MTLEQGTLLNERYRIIAELGSGGMGAVYHAHDENLDVDVAVKENFFVSEESARQFKREASLLAKLSHPNLPRVTDHFVIPDQGQYLVMDYVRGDDARQLLEKAGEPLGESLVLGLAKEILQAIKHLHSHKPPIIHRDIKPGNIKLTPDGKAVLVDFGLAKEHDPLKSTTVGAKAFTPGFAPPEQYGQGRTDVRTDIYSLGATLYNLLTAKIPADGLRRAMGRERLISIRDLNPNVTPHVAAAIERAAEVKPEDRFAGAKEFEAALFAGPTVIAPLPATVVRPAAAGPLVSPGTAPVAQPRRGWLIPAILGAVVLLAIGTGAGLLLTGALAGLGGSQAAGTSEPAATALPTELATQPVVAPQPSATPTMQATREPTAVPAPTEIPTATLTATPAMTPVGGGGGQIAFVSDRFGVPQIFSMNADGSDETQLTTLSDGACQPAWSPDGETLLFVSPCREKKSSYPNAAIYSMNPDGSDVQVLISRPGGVYDPDWSETGIAFTYLENNIPGIWLANPDGSNQVKLSRGRSRDSQPSWSPGGDKLAVMNTSRAGSPTIFWVFSDGSFNGSNPDQVTREQEADSPAWSPDGDLIAYVVVTHIYVVRWDKVGFGNVRLTLKGPNDSPSWSPDGQWIAFETWRDAANHDIYIMTANGGQPTRLTDDLARDYQPAWKP